MQEHGGHFKSGEGFGATMALPVQTVVVRTRDISKNGRIFFPFCTATVQHQNSVPSTHIKQPPAEKQERKNHTYKKLVPVH